jgi:hypothetical protein
MLYNFLGVIYGVFPYLFNEVTLVAPELRQKKFYNIGTWGHDTQHNATQHMDFQQNSKYNATLSMMTLRIMVQSCYVVCH